MARRLATVACLATLFLMDLAGAPDVARADGAGPASVQTSIRGATQMFAAPWGLAAQGSGMLRILPLGTSKWQTVHQVIGGSLYRIAFDDGGRLLAWWENEPHIHLFVPRTKAHETLPLPPPPSPEFKYGYGVEDMYFTKGGDGAIVYMHGFVGGRTWVAVVYHYDLARHTAPTLLFRQPGHVLHTSARMAIYAIPKKPDDACEHNFCPMWLTASGEVVEVWSTDERGLEIRGHSPNGGMKVASLAPLPRRTPHDRPLFNIAGVMERANGDLFFHWGEYLVLLPVNGPARRLDLRTAFKRKAEISSRLLHARSPEGIWVGIESGKNLDMTFLPEGDLEARMTPAP